MQNIYKYSEVQIDEEDKYLKDQVMPQNKLIIIDIQKLTRIKMLMMYEL